MKQSRRDFLAGTAWMGMAALSAGCISKGSGLAGLGRGAGAPMHGFRVAPMKKVRVGMIGVGSRGTGAVRRIAQIPGCEITALSDINPKRLDENQAWLKERGYKAPKEWSRNGDEEAWKGLCDSDVCDVVYSATPRPLHAPINVYAMDHGKHVLQEVPGAFSLEECWATVEAAERNRRHCMMLENCTYGEEEMLAFNLIHKGKLGEVVQAEVGYQHDQRSLQYNPRDGRFWRIDRHLHHHGNYYPTHGLVPAGRCLDINRGDRFEYLVSMETKSASFEQFGRDNFPATDWRHSAKMVRGDINMSMIRTAKGKVVTLAHNVCTPRPYDRGNLYMGTNGIFRSYPSLLMSWEEKTGDNGAHQYFPADKALKIKEEYRHPFWKVAGDIAKKVGGHGGMDFIMDLRWAYCLQNGLPLDTDVYDLATYSSIVELTEKSVNARSAAIDFPDYTKGGWKTAQPFTVDEIDISKFGW
ncbi:MAG: Gfo/Idh/MocA family oxidoreductase [Kiritimatiellae bacterium]|jgi:hypothetical protein|nr:Gfo/Idh/MocA family oxidoreductase [Kiritimatiellia bacterium]MDD3584689.1 Gfo/Idh/MocA family oxidoreductase [Kiritimatiellia bacterium]HHU14774.1 Gfo/Idh/MocA family oxidoreductase [Lentisphaerota bacterium]HON47525.1 Gfo/Idh/MocA family oxidoreductase [Kiritimatiellia bacterium]HRT29290.1 Gfo/Idh/MocA family oxidoreductase [Kiritimatiellia bacterium]